MIAMLKRLLRWLFPWWFQNAESEEDNLPPIPHIPPIDPAQNLRTIEILAPPGHGKTAFLWAASGHLARLDQIFEECFIEPTEATKRRLKETAARAEAGNLPASTQEHDPTKEPETYEMLCRQLPFWGNRRIHFEDRQDTALSPTSTEELPARPYHSVLVVLVNPDLFCRDADPERGLAVLGEKLYHLISRMGSGVQIVLALSQAERLEIPVGIWAHLRNDPLAGLWPDATSTLSVEDLRDRQTEFFSEEYLAKLEDIDRQLQTWLKDQTGGSDFLQMIEMTDSQCRICAISALGSNPEDGEMLFHWTPRRVLDPLLWAWHFGAG